MKLKQALEHSKTNKERLETEGLSIIGAAYDAGCNSAPFKFFSVKYDEDDGPWFSISYCGGQLWADGSDGEEEFVCGETGADVYSNFLELFSNVASLSFIETADIDIQCYAEVVLPDLLNDIPDSESYWPSRKQEYEALCITALQEFSK